MWWAREDSDGVGLRGEDRGALNSDRIKRHHSHRPRENQCSSSVFKRIKAPVNLVWSVVRRFDQPQRYKPFISRCVIKGDVGIGTVREVDMKSGLPATTSTERLECLDEDEHVLGIEILGGDHRLTNYKSVISLHPEVIDGSPGTLVVESFVVDVPEGNTKDETCFFVEAFIKCNHKSLAELCERPSSQGLHDNSILTQARV
ncbi:regulatory components of ABA receptor 3 [Wolffia australiana]